MALPVPFQRALHWATVTGSVQSQFAVHNLAACFARAFNRPIQGTEGRAL